MTYPPIDITQEMLDDIRSQGMSVTIDGVGGPLGAYLGDVPNGNGVDILKSVVAKFK
jgi:hypothetical protein